MIGPNHRSRFDRGQRASMQANQLITSRSRGAVVKARGPPWRTRRATRNPPQLFAPRRRHPRRRRLGCSGPGRDDADPKAFAEKCEDDRSHLPSLECGSLSRFPGSPASWLHAGSCRNRQPQQHNGDGAAPSAAPATIIRRKFTDRALNQDRFALCRTVHRRPARLSPVISPVRYHPICLPQASLRR